MLDCSEMQIIKLLEEDDVYQKLLTACSMAEPAYRQVLQNLTSHEQDVIERYISLCEELDHRKLTLVLHHLS